MIVPFVTIPFFSLFTPFNVIFSTQDARDGAPQASILAIAQIQLAQAASLHGATLPRWHLKIASPILAPTHYKSCTTAANWSR